MKEHAERIATGTAATALLAVLAWRFLRMHFGIDFTDESFYAASALRFANGALPLVDEINLGALCEWLVAPVLHISGGDAGGSVLLLRWTHLFFSIGVGGVVMFALWPHCKPGESILFGTLPIAFVPFSVPMPSCNTLGVGLFTCGSVLVFRLQQRPDRRFAMAAGFSHALATLARPELVVGTAATAFTLMLRGTEQDQRKLALPYLCGALSVGIVLAAYLGVIGPNRLAESFAYMSSLGSAELSASKFLSSLRVCLNLLLQPQESASSLAWVFWASFITFPVFIFLRRSLEARRVLLSVAIPSIVGGFAVAAGSTNGFINMPIGWFPSLLVVLALFMPKSRPLRILPFGAVLVFILILSVAQAAVYRDEQLSKLDSIVSHGAWAGIRTTRGRLQFIEDVRHDIQTAAKRTGARTFLAYDRFPAGYLLSDLQPTTNTVWLFEIARFPKLDRTALLQYLDRQHDWPDLVLRMKRIPEGGDRFFTLSYPPSDDFNRRIESAEYVPVINRQNYTLYARRQLF